MKEGTDAVSIVPNDEDFSSTQRSTIFIEETTINDHLFNAILAATPDTNFIGDGAPTGPDIEEPQRKPLVVRTLHPKTDFDGNPYVPKSIFHDHIQETEEEEEEICAIEGNALDDHQTNQSLDGSLVGSFILDRTHSDDGSTVTSASSLDYATIISRRLDNVNYRFINDGALDFSEQVNKETEEAEGSGTNSPDSQIQDYEMVPENEALQVTRQGSLVSRLCSQYGLNEQNYQCYQCRTFIGMFYGEFRVCSMDGRSYCLSCHTDKTAIIPGRVLMNWDLRQYPVCDATSKWLEDHFNSPMLDIRATNPKLYSHVEELRLLKVSSIFPWIFCDRKNCLLIRSFIAEIYFFSRRF